MEASFVNQKKKTKNKDLAVGLAEADNVNNSINNFVNNFVNNFHN